MWTKALLCAGAVLLLAQNISACAKGELLKGVREYIEIENTTYYIDVQNRCSRDEAKDLCLSLNMSMVRFESENKWLAIDRWLADSEYYYNWFWNDALRDEGSTSWYWEATGAEIADFYWAPGQPTMNEILIKSCIYFSHEAGGWTDDHCQLVYLNAMCE